MSLQVVLHSYFRSSCSYRVRIALNLKNIEYTVKPVNLLNNEHTSDKYKVLNALGVVPTLEMDGHVLTQSMAIIDYLDATHRVPKLCSEDEWTRHKQLALVTLIGMDMQPLHNLTTLQRLDQITGGDAKVKEDWVKYFLIRGFDAVEQFIRLNSSTKRFSIGDSVSLGDVCLAPQAYVARRFGLDLAGRYPNVWSVYKNLMTIDAFRKAHPHSQPDCPDNLKSDLSM